MDPTYLETTYSFVRLTNQPLDKSSHFETYDDLRAAYDRSTYTGSPFYDGQIITVEDNANGGFAYVFQKYNKNNTEVTNLDQIVTKSYYDTTVLRDVEAAQNETIYEANQYTNSAIENIIFKVYNIRGVSSWNDKITYRDSYLYNSKLGDVWIINEDFSISGSDQRKAGDVVLCYNQNVNLPAYQRFTYMKNIFYSDYYTKEDSDTRFVKNYEYTSNIITGAAKTVMGNAAEHIEISNDTKLPRTGLNIIDKIYGKSIPWNQLLKEGYLVDMGLPSGTLWASRNIDITQEDGFAASPFQYESSFFSWGNVDGHNPISNTAFDYDWGGINSAEPWYDGQVYGSTPGNTLTGNIAVGEDFDAARANLDAPWRMPTSAEFAELFANIKYINADGTEVDTTKTDKRVTVNGILGLYIQSNINCARLFFSCSGYGNGRSWYNRGSSGNYWSSAFSSARHARTLLFSSGGVYPQYSSNRYYGFAIRPVLTHKLTSETDGNGHKFIQYGNNITDLTRVFGAGNEPSTVEEFKKLFPNDYYPYNPGEIINNKLDYLTVSNIDEEFSNILDLNVCSLTGKLNGTGESVTIFPNGMCSVGNIKDTIEWDEDGYARKVIKRVGSVDLGELTWSYYTDGQYPCFFGESLTGLINPNNSISSRYVCYTGAGRLYNVDIDKVYRCQSDGANYLLEIKDSSHTNADTFAITMSGVILEYELATPQIYILDTPLPLTFFSYANSDLRQAPAFPNSTSTELDIVLPADMNKDYINEQSLDNFLIALGTAQGKTWTKQYDETTHSWSFSYV